MKYIQLVNYDGAMSLSNTLMGNKENNNVLLMDPLPNNQIWYKSSDGSVITPSNPTGFGGATIVSNTYTNGKGIITFNQDVTSLTNGAFSNKSLLISIRIPSSVTTINYNAMSGTGLKSVVIPNGVTTLNAGAFENCANLEFVKIPNSVTTLSSAFGSCDNLKVVEVAVPTIQAGCFTNTITTLILNEGVTTIGSSAFNGYTELSSVTMANSIVTIGNASFSGCSKLESINIGNNVTTISEAAFANCTLLSNVIFGNNVQSIGHSSFYSCSMNTITLPVSVTNIGQSAFSLCANLNSINYTGTIEKWNNITFGTYWHYNVPATVVHCTDGDVTLS